MSPTLGVPCVKPFMWQTTRQGSEFRVNAANKLWISLCRRLGKIIGVDGRRI